MLEGNFNLRFIKDREIYKEVIQGEVCTAEKFVWIATADIKDLYIKKSSKMVPFLELLSDLIDRKVSIRIIHAGEPGPRFRKDFDRYENLLNGLEQIQCPRVHFKSVIIDGKTAYTGSANLTGAGMGAKSSKRRNFENGILTEDPELVEAIMDQFDDIWMGNFCRECDRKQFCTYYTDILR